MSSGADDSIPEASGSIVPPTPSTPVGATPGTTSPAATKLSVADRVSHFKNINENVHQKPAVAHTAPAVKFKVETAVPKCPICQKSVYKVEELNALGQVWHKGCYRCGGNNPEQLGCHRVMTTKENVETHSGHVYCSACAHKLFKSGSAAEAISAPNIEAEQAERKKALSGVKGLVSKRASHYVADTSSTTEQDPNEQSIKPKPGGADKFRDPNYAQNMMEKCVCCQKPVYKAEELRSFGALFHKSCFVCGGAEVRVFLSVRLIAL
jgi:cysteine/glycine-rich protein